MAMVKVMVAMTPEMKAALEKEAKARKLPGIQDVIRQAISEHLAER